MLRRLLLAAAVLAAAVPPSPARSQGPVPAIARDLLGEINFASATTRYGGGTTNGYRLRVVARTGETIDGRKILSLYSVGPATLETGPLARPVLNDDRHVAFIAATDHGQTIFVDRKAVADTGMGLGGFPVVTLGRPALSRTGSTLAYHAVTKECPEILCNYESIVLNGAQVLKTGQEIAGCGKIGEISDPQINAAGAYGVVVLTTGFLRPCLLVNGRTVLAFADILNRLVPTFGEGLFSSGISGFTFLDDGTFMYTAVASGTSSHPEATDLLCFSRDCRPVSRMPRLPVVNERRQYVYNPSGLLMTREGRYVNGVQARTFAMNDGGQIFTNEWELLSYAAATVKPVQWTPATPYSHPHPIDQHILARALCPLERVACAKHQQFYNGGGLAIDRRGDIAALVTHNSFQLTMYEALVVADSGGPAHAAARTGKPSLVDPIPLSGSAASRTLLNPTALAGSEARQIDGVAADGVARVVVRIPASAPQIAISVCAQKSPASCGNLSADDYGTLATLDDLTKDLSERAGLTRRALRVIPVSAGGSSEGFVVYRAPLDFVRKARSGGGEPVNASANANGDCPSGYDRNDCAAASRDVFLKFDAGGAPHWIQVKIVRPPVVLIHGLWASAQDLGELAQLEHDRRFSAVAIDYGMKVTLQRSDPAVNWVKEILNAVTGSSLGVAYGSRVTVKNVVERVLPEFRRGRNGGPAVAAAQVDVVAHSLGAVIARTIQPASVRQANYGAGAVHKIVSIAGPHRGSPLAAELVRDTNRCVRDQMAWVGLYAFGDRADAVKATTPSGDYLGTGAMGDLVGDSDGQYPSAAISQLANVHQRAPIAYVAGRMSVEQIQRDIVPAIVVNNSEARVVGGISHGVHGPSAEGVDERPINNVQELRLRCPHDPLATAFASPANFTRLLSGASDGVVPLVSQIDRTSPANAEIIDGVVHSPGTGVLYNVRGRGEKSLLDDRRVLPIVRSLLNMASGDSQRYHR